MTTAAIIRLVLQGLVFLVWAFLMFKVLFTLRRRAEAETGQAFSGPFAFMKQIGAWLRAPEDRQERNTLFFLTFVLIAMTLVTAMTATPPPG